MKSVSALLCALLGACFLLTSCTTVPPQISVVTVTLVGFRPVENADARDHAIMTLKVATEDVHSEGFNSSSHRLYLNNMLVGKAENLNPIGLPAEGSVTIDVPFVIEDAVTVRRAIAVSDQAAYRLESELRYSEGESNKRFKTKSEGKIPLSGLEHAVR